MVAVHHEFGVAVVSGEEGFVAFFLCQRDYLFEAFVYRFKCFFCCCKVSAVTDEIGVCEV